MTADHVHDLASVSKVMTALALGVLFARSVLAPTDTLGRVLGDVAAAHRATTIGATLAHRGGFAPWWPLYLEQTAPLKAALARAPIASPGSAYHYSDLGMQALGGVIEAATALPLATAIEELVLAPLGATSLTAGAPAAGAPVLAGQRGDAIERAMVASGSPYPVATAGADSFPWRTEVLRGAIGDGNAHHAFGGVAGHAGWFGDLDGLLALAGGLCEPERLGITDAQPDLGVRAFSIEWNGSARRFIGHGGFTGSFVAAAPACGDAPPVRVALLANRLCGDAGPTGRATPGAEQLGRRAIAIINQAGR